MAYLDGLIVSVDGKTSRCRQQPVDYVSWDSLRTANASESTNSHAGPSVDSLKRVRVPWVRHRPLGRPWQSLGLPTRR